MTKVIQRCEWCGQDPLYVAYHDNEWGIPVTDDQKLFEMLVLEGMQAGLSWITILKRREDYKKLFHQFDVEKVAKITPAKIEKLLQNPKIIRNRKKVESIKQNAQACLDLKTSLSEFLWGFVDGEPIQNHWKSLKSIPAQTKISESMSKALKKAGFTFVGPTICYAFMQAVGMVNDHIVSCYRYEEICNS